MNTPKKPDTNFFRPLATVERRELFDTIAMRRIEITLWEKGSSYSEKFFADDLEESNLDLYVKSAKSTQLIAKNLLLSFEFLQIQYFATGSLSTITEKNNYLLKVENLYKCEKRKNFRYSLSSDPTAAFIQNGAQFKLVDISVGGVCLAVSKSELHSLTLDKTITNFSIQFDGEKIDIIEAKLAYQKNYPGDSDKLLVGVQFIGISAQIEAFLFRKLNTLLFKQIIPDKKA